jgi:type II secretion system protein E
MEYQKLGNLLISKGLLTPADWHGVMELEPQTLADLSEVLVETGRVPDNDWALAVADVYELPYLSEIGEVDEELLAKVPSDLAFKRLALPLRRDNGSVVVAVTDPEPDQVYEDFRILTGAARIKVEIAGEKSLRQAIQRSYGATVERMAADLRGGTLEEGSTDETGLEVDHDIGNLRELAGEPTVVNLVNLILFEAIRDKASDVHIEPFEAELKLRYRIDGMLKEMPPPPKHLRLAITSRVKIMAGMNIAERFIPQDGHIRLSMEGKQIDLRVSCCPTVYGESVVLRILDKSSLILDIHQLGLAEEDRAQFNDIIHRPHGIFLVTGPTGSGKTTTLYTALSLIFSPTLKIITVEDPVEYHLPGVCQIQVNPKRGVTFASGLRSIMRQDPDVIMVGEIRDGETAEIAIRSALTGHLVFSTLHTNTAAGAVPRLMDMGIDPFLISSSLNGILAQRLVRRICSNCKEQYEPTAEEKVLSMWQHVDQLKFFRGAGCEECGFSGYKGRVGIFEIILLNDELREMILKRPSASMIAQTSGGKSFREDGWRKVDAGITTMEEVLRVAVED